MRVDVIMPQMGESIAEGTLTKWMKKAGEKVARDEPIFEISTDKVDAEIPSPAAGLLAEILVQEGQTVPINTVVARIETEGTAAASAGAAAPAGKAAPEKPASRPATPTPVATPVATPAAARPPAVLPAAATAGSAGRPAGGPASGPVSFPKAAAMAAAGAGLEEMRRVRSSPVVRRIATERQIDIGQISGTGAGGRVSKRDILAALESGAAAAPSREGAPAAAPFASAMAAPAYAPGERITVVPMTAMRRKIAEHMVLSRNTSAHVTTVFEVDLQRLMKLRDQHRAEFEARHGVRLTVTPLMVRAAIEALKAFPVVNASLDGDNVVYKKDINVGVAVALEAGLIVPVIKHAEDLSLSGIAKAVTDLAVRARNKKLTPDEVQGGTFTITNPGIFGSLFGTPIISQPQVAIMGVGAIVKRPVAVDDAIAVHPTVHLALSFDHRLLDGAVADQFMAHIKETLEEARFPDLV